MILLPPLQVISPPDPIGLLTAVIFMVAGIASILAGILGRAIQKRPLPVPAMMVLVGLADIAYSYKYAQLILPGFPGNPIPSAEIRPFLLLISFVALSVPVGFWITGDRELKLMQQINERVEQERNLAQFMEGKLKDQLDVVQAEKRAQQRMFDELRTLIITNVGHELRTPLTILMGYLQMVLSGTFGEVIGTPLGEPIGAAEATSRRMKVVVDRMLIPLRTPYFENVELARIARQLVDDPNIYLGTRRDPDDVSITSDIPDSLVVFGDQLMLRTAVFELLNNAIKFGATAVSLVVLEQNGEMVAKVRDNGIGVSRKFHKRIFEPLYQVRMDSKRPYEGSGMGLAVVAEVALVHDGYCTVESRLGQGATFTFAIPARSVVPPGEDTPEDVTAEGKD